MTQGNFPGVTVMPDFFKESIPFLPGGFFDGSFSRPAKRGNVYLS
jgi:hypothetical protein